MVELFHSLAARVSDFAREVAQTGRHAAVPAASVGEPCLSCGEKTAAGSVFYSDRLKVARDDGSEVFLCGPCEARIRAAHKPEHWSREDVAAFTKNASAMDITWSNRM